MNDPRIYLKPHPRTLALRLRQGQTCALSHLASSLLMLTTAVGCSVATGEAAADSAGADSTVPACLPTLACAAPAAPQTSLQPWRHPIETPTLVTTDAITGLPAVPYHRGRDLFVNPGQPQVAVAHFTYGLANVDLTDEDVDVYVQRDCASGWESLGTATTTTGSAPHAPFQGITDGGGHVFFEVPQDKQLGPGLHRFRMIVRGDGSSTDVLLDVVPPKTPIFVSDVDGTLTSSEDIEYAAVLVGRDRGHAPRRGGSVSGSRREGLSPALPDRPDPSGSSSARAISSTRTASRRASFTRRRRISAPPPTAAPHSSRREISRRSRRAQASRRRLASATCRRTRRPTGRRSPTHWTAYFIRSAATTPGTASTPTRSS